MVIAFYFCICDAQIPIADPQFEPLIVGWSVSIYSFNLIQFLRMLPKICF